MAQTLKLWKKEKLGKLCKWGSGGTPLKSHKEYYGGNIKWAIIGDLNEGILFETQNTITKEGLNNSSAKIVPRDALLIGMYGSIGKTAITGCEMATNQAIAFAIPDPTKLNLHYLKYFINYSVSELFRLSKGGTQKNISQEILKSFEIPLPDIPEQQQIVDEIEKQLTRLDDSVKTLKDVKEKLKIYRESILKVAFTEGFSDSISFEKLHLDDFKAEGKHSIKRGPFGSAIKKSFFVPKGENTYKVYEQKNAIYNNFSLGNYYINKEKFEELKSFEVKPGDLIISCSGTIGRIAIAPENMEPGVINQALLKLSLNPKVIRTKYFIYLFQSKFLQLEILKNTRGSAMLNISSVKDLKKIDFPVPDLKSQDHIISEIESRFSVIDKVEELVDNSLKKAEQLRKSILKAAFEGKLVKGETHV